MATTPKPSQVLDLPLPKGNDAGASTVRDYLTKLLALVWEHAEGFSGKRPFGNSDWQYDIYVELIKAGFVDGKLDEDGYVEHVDHGAADKLITRAIKALGMPPARMPDVKGYCPMGCGRTLFLDDEGHVVCSWHECPNPTAADELLADPETEHVVVITPQQFTVKHPARERLNDELLDCLLAVHLRSQAGPPIQPGHYRVRPKRDDGASWQWERICGCTSHDPADHQGSCGHCGAVEDEYCKPGCPVGVRDVAKDGA